MPTATHPLNRHFFIADNLALLRRLDNESIDLICTDPPFAKNQTWVGNLKPLLSDVERQQEMDMLASWGIRDAEDAAKAGIDWPGEERSAKFKDMWRWENDVHEEWVERIKGDYPSVHKLIDATQEIHGESTAAYLCYIAIRLFEMQRVLKDTGSLYLHCDHTAGAYLRQLLDAIFGKEGFRNAIVWAYTGPSSPRIRQFNRKHDIIFWYSKGAQWHFDKEKSRVPYKDGKPHTGGFTHQSGAKKGTAMDKDVANKYTQGKILEDWWPDIAIAARSKYERTGYPTQKPVALAERIIKASCPEGGVVLDCFAGCAYVPVAAELNGHQWIACDISPRALTVLRRQFHYLVDGEQTGQEPMPIAAANVTTRGPHQLPERTDEDPVQRYDFKEPAERRFKIPASIIPDGEMLEKLLELSDYTAWCCGFANRRPDGSIIKTKRNFHLDRLDPKSKEGSNEITNRAPMCPAHNMRKNKRRVHLSEYRKEIADAGEMMVDSSNDLINLAWAEQQALDIYAEERMRRDPQMTLRAR